MTNFVPQTQKTRAVIVLSALSVLYVGAFVILVGETKPCEGIISPSWFFGFFDRYLTCRDVNELGDALAGAFAPVAFLWLAGAVFIQSRELNETQDVMRAQLVVSQAQVDETRASTAMLKRQTEILVEQHQRRQQEIADHTLEGTIDALRNFLKTSSLQIDFTEYRAIRGPTRDYGFRMPEWFPLRENEVAGQEEHQYDLFGTSNRDVELAEITRILRHAAADATQHIKRIENAEAVHRRAFDFSRAAVQRLVVGSLISLLEQLTSLSPVLSAAARVRLVSTGIDLTIGKLQEFVTTFDAFVVRMNALKKADFPDAPED